MLSPIPLQLPKSAPPTPQNLIWQRPSRPCGWTNPIKSPAPPLAPWPFVTVDLSPETQFYLVLWNSALTCLSSFLSNQTFSPPLHAPLLPFCPCALGFRPRHSLLLTAHRFLRPVLSSWVATSHECLLSTWRVAQCRWAVRVKYTSTFKDFGYQKNENTPCLIPNFYKDYTWK